MLKLEDAKARFSAVVAAALSGSPQTVTKRGKPAVVVLSVEDYERLLTQAKTRRESFAEHLLKLPDFELAARTLQARDIDL